MATLEEFYQWLVSLFKEGEHRDYDAIKEKMEEAGYGEMTGHDVYNAVNAMIEEGDVFTSDQSSQLNAYTGGNQVSQGAYAPTTTSMATSGSGGGAPAAAQAPAYTPPPPPPLDPGYGESELDAAIRQIVYVNNVSNNTYIEDNDYFSDNDTIIDSSVNQSILAHGDVHQDFDTTIAAGEAVANSGEIENSAVITGGVEDSLVAGGDAHLDGSAVGDGNTILNDSNGAIVGDGNTSLYGNDIDGAVALGGGDAMIAEQIAGGDAIETGGNVNTGAGDQVEAHQSVVGTGGSEVTGNTGHMDNSNIGSGEGDINAIQGSMAEAAAFGSGSVEANDTLVDIDDSVGVNTGDHGDAQGETDHQVVDIDHSAGVGVSNEGDAEGTFEPELEIDLAVEEKEVEFEH
jgi:hypothetical protein